MHLFFPSRKKGDLFYISGDEYRHLRVRRVHPGEELGIIHEGKIYRCVLREKGKGYAVAETVSVSEPDIPEIELTLYQSVTHSLATMDLIVQKAVELGVTRLVPLLTERSFAGTSAVEKRLTRWKRIIGEAMKQSGRAHVMALDPPRRLEDLNPEHGLNILLDNFHDGKRMEQLDLKGVSSVSVVVGPEGGFSRAEVNTLRERGFTPVRLKPYVLRTETAVITAVGIIVNLAGP